MTAGRPWAPASDAVADRSLVVVSAGLSQPSATRLLADRLAAATQRQLTAAGLTADLRTIEAREHATDLANNLLTGFPAPELESSIEAVLAADGLIAVSPIFSASYSGLFKTFFDVIEHGGLRGMPVLVAATGGTARHSLALEHVFRPLFSYLGAAVVRTAVYAAAEDWGGDDATPDAFAGGLADRIERAAAELSAAMVPAPRARPNDPYASPIPFERLLAGDGPD